MIGSFCDDPAQINRVVNILISFALLFADAMSNCHTIVVNLVAKKLLLASICYLMKLYDSRHRMSSLSQYALIKE